MYTIKEAAKILGKSVNYVSGLIHRGIVPAEDNKITEEGIQIAERYARTVSGMVVNRPWLVSLLPWYYDQLALSDKEAARMACARWVNFLNGRWTQEKPAVPGMHLVKALHNGIPVYRHFNSMEQIEQWVGYFWSAALPFPYMVE